MPNKNRIGKGISATLNVLKSLAFNGVQVVNGASFDRLPKVAIVPLVAADTAGGAFSWQNPELGAIVVIRAVVDVTTKATGAGTLSVGMTATSGTTSAANLIDTLDVGTATGTFDNIQDKGTNGTSRQKVAAGKWVTGSKATGSLAGIVGVAYIEYLVI